VLFRSSHTKTIAKRKKEIGSKPYDIAKDTKKAFSFLGNYPVCVNTKIINKNIDAETGEILKGYSKLAYNFKNASLSFQELIRHIRTGYPIIFGLFKFNPNTFIIPSIEKENWGLSQLFAIDVDKGLTLQDAMDIDITKKSLFIYTTASHTKTQHKFRIIFNTGRSFTNSDVYSYLVSKFIKIYGADEQCKNVNRIFYGNTDAEIYIYDKQNDFFKQI